MFNYKSRHQPGFTLIETMIAALIGASFMISVGMIFTRLIRTQSHIISNTNLQKTTDQVLLNLTQEARWAESITQAQTNLLEFQTDEACYRYERLSNSILEKKSALLDTSTSHGCWSGTTGNFHPQGTIATSRTVETLNPPTLAVTNFDIINRTSGLGNPSFEVNMTMQIKGTATSFTNRTAITPRNL